MTMKISFQTPFYTTSTLVFFTELSACGKKPKFIEMRTKIINKPFFGLVPKLHSQMSSLSVKSASEKFSRLGTFNVICTLHMCLLFFVISGFMWMNRYLSCLTVCLSAGEWLCIAHCTLHHACKYSFQHIFLSIRLTGVLAFSSTVTYLIYCPPSPLPP